MKFDRKFYIPAGYELVRQDESLGLEVWAGELSAMCFAGKRSKPDWYIRFRTAERMNAKIEETIANLKKHHENVAQRREARNVPHDVKVGEIFRCSWGYDQTNIDYYEVTKVIGQMVEIREVAQVKEETAAMQGDCAPMSGKYIGEPMRKKVSVHQWGPTIRIYSFASAYRIKPVATVAGKDMYAPSHWTAYH